MSKEIVEVNIHYGQEDFKKLFEGLVKSTIGVQEPVKKNNNELVSGKQMEEVHPYEESSKGDKQG